MKVIRSIRSEGGKINSLKTKNENESVILRRKELEDYKNFCLEHFISQTVLFSKMNILLIEGGNLIF